MRCFQWNELNPERKDGEKYNLNKIMIKNFKKNNNRLKKFS